MYISTQFLESNKHYIAPLWKNLIEYTIYLAQWIDIFDQFFAYKNVLCKKIGEVTNKIHKIFPPITQIYLRNQHEGVHTCRHKGIQAQNAHLHTNPCTHEHTVALTQALTHSCSQAGTPSFAHTAMHMHACKHTYKYVHTRILDACMHPRMLTHVHAKLG